MGLYAQEKASFRKERQIKRPAFMSYLLSLIVQLSGQEGWSFNTAQVP